MTLADKIFSRKRAYKTPWFSWYFTITITGVYFLIHFKEHFQRINMDTFTTFGAPNAVEIYSGQYWGVFTNNFIHIYPFQLLLNLLGIWMFGAFLERRMKIIELVHLFFIGTIIPSLLQLAFTDDAGIGLSAANFTLIGFILIHSRTDIAFRLYKQNLIVLGMLLLFAYCLYYNLSHKDEFRIISMFSGFVFGMLIAWLKTTRRWIQISSIALLYLLSLPTLIYAPWSTEWHLHKGVLSHENNDYTKASYYYERALKIEPGNPIAVKNLELLEIDKLKSKAYRAHLAGHYLEARAFYEDILKKSPDDSWAKQNLNELP